MNASLSSSVADTPLAQCLVGFCSNSAVDLRLPALSSMIMAGTVRKQKGRKSGPLALHFYARQYMLKTITFWLCSVFEHRLITPLGSLWPFWKTPASSPSMLSRHSSNASLGARRSKSTSSFRHSRSSEEYAGFESKDIAHARAVTAAERAFELAKARRRAIRTAGEAGEKSIHDHAQRPALTRQKSIRFAGPTAVPLRCRSITRSNVAAPHAKAESQDSHADNSKVEQLTTQQSDHEEQLLEQAFGSQPSSYRRLSKSKSLFALNKKQLGQFATGMPKAGQHFRRHSVRSSESSQGATRTKPLPLKRKLSFLRPWTSRPPETNRQYTTNDEAVRLARDQFAHDVEQQRLKQRPSFLNLMKGHRPHKAFPRSVRKGSTDSYGDVVSSSSNATDTLRSGSAGDKARSYSQSLRNRLRKVFLRQSSNGEGDVPAQHLDATRQHFGNGRGMHIQEDCPYPCIPSPDAEVLQRVGSREFGEDHDLIPSKQNQAFGSIRSIPSQGNASMDHSRVTSWTDSTAANTIHIPQFSDRKRLSVIKEDGNAYQPPANGPSFARPDYGYAAFQQPYRQNSSSEPPEPQRIFSALQKEIVKKNSYPTIGGSESEMDYDSDHPGPDSSSDTIQRYGSPPQQNAIAKEAKADRTKRPLHELGSGFFHASQHIEQKQSPSPYRRALRSTEENVGGFPMVAMGAGRSQRNGNYPSGRTLAESVYSRSPGGFSHGYPGNSLAFMDADNAEDRGTALGLPAEAGPYASHQHRLRERRDWSDLSSTSSGEWKRRLATEMISPEERNPQIDDDVYNALPVRDGRLGHRREHAQLHSTEAGIEKVIKEGRASAQSLVLSGSDLHSRRSLQNLQSHQQGPERFSDENQDPLAHSKTYGQSENVSYEGLPTHTQAPMLPEGQDNSGTLRKISNNVPRNTSSASPRGLDNDGAYPGGLRHGSRLEIAERVQALRSESSSSLKGSGSATKSTSKAGFLTENRTVSNLQARENLPPIKRRTSKENSASPNSAPTYGQGNRLLVENFLRDRRREMRISEEAGGPPAFL